MKQQRWQQQQKTANQEVRKQISEEVQPIENLKKEESFSQKKKKTSKVIWPVKCKYKNNHSM